MEGSAEAFVSPSAKAGCQVLLRLPGMGNWIPTSLSYWWEAVPGKRGLKHMQECTSESSRLDP